MRLTPAVLVITDISGYTSFIKHRAVSLLHAEAIVTDLLEAVIDRAAHPLAVNKLEGDAALLYAETGVDPAPAIRDAVAQIAAFFDAFAARLGLVRDQRRHCMCEACSNITGLALKAFVHHGEVAVKQVRQFEELAGEEVILIHRLLKNHVPSREYVLMTEPVKRAIGDAVPESSPLREEIEGLDPVTVWWAPREAPSLRGLARSRLRSALKSIRASLDSNDVDGAKKALSATVSIVDKMATKGIIHRNTAGRYKSRLSARLAKSA